MSCYTEYLHRPSTQAVKPCANPYKGGILETLQALAKRFIADGKALSIQEYGSGNVNDTFLVTTDSEKCKKFILQRINTTVFSRPELIMRNLRTFTDHVQRRLQNKQRSSRAWKVPCIIPAADDNDYVITASGEFWRAISFIGGAKTHETVQNMDHAREAGYALGRFHSLIYDLPTKALHDTLEGFHVTPLYLKHFDEVVKKGPTASKSADNLYCHEFITERREWAHVLENAKKANQLLLRPIHGDPKISNIMIEEQTGKAISIIDLDTVKPGLIHYDLGDCLRSCCNPAGEEAENLQDVHFDTDLCRAILQGYLSEARAFLRDADYRFLFDAVRLIAFELGLRFFTDNLAGDVYFKVGYKGHNLRRALVQFRLTESIESQERTIRRIVKEFL